MKKFLLFILISSSAAATSASYKNSDKNICFSIDSINKEYLDWESIKINGKLPLITSAAALFQLIGQPDSITTPDLNDICTSYYDKDFKHVFFKESLFEIYGDTAVFVSVDFRYQQEIELKVPYFTLNHKTTLTDLGKFFPNAVNSKYEVNIYPIGKTECIRLALSKAVTEYAFLLFFIEGKLIRIDYFMPC